MQRECVYCGAPLTRGRYENDNIFKGRDYCFRPKCLARGKRASLEAIYEKQNDNASSRLHVSFLTRYLFIMRWGIDPIQAFDEYEKLASSDWEFVYNKVARREAMRVEVDVKISDPEGDVLEHFDLDEAVMLPDESTLESEAAEFAKWLQFMLVNESIHGFLEDSDGS